MLEDPRYTSSLTLEQFRNDDKTVDAVVRNLEVIGEAAKKLPETVRRQIGDLDWPRIAGLRDVLIHDYFAVDLEIIWDAWARQRVPESRKVAASRRRPLGTPASRRLVRRRPGGEFFARSQPPRRRRSYGIGRTKV